MNKFAALSFALVLATSQVAQAAQITAEQEDTSVGKGFGGLTGLMVGAAAGGPIGAVVGAVAGAFVGGGVQQGTGNAQKAYVVETASGEQTTFRSPNETYAVGDEVRVVAGRLQAVDSGERLTAR